MNIKNLLSYQQTTSSIESADINVAHCAALGLSIDLYIIDHSNLKDDNIVDILDVFTQTSEIMLNHDSYRFEMNDTVDVVEKKLLDLFQALRRNGFRAAEIIEDDEYIGFQDRFGTILKARKVGDNK